MRTPSPALAAIAVAAFALAACDNTQATQNTAPARPIKVTGEAQQSLHTASDLNRAIALKRAIYDAGYRCSRITRSGYVADYRNLEMWKASCADGRDWAVFIGPDGSAQVRDCKDVASVGLPECKVTAEEGTGGKVPVANTAENSAAD